MCSSQSRRKRRCQAPRRLSPKEGDGEKVEGTKETPNSDGRAYMNGHRQTRSSGGGFMPRYREDIRRRLTNIVCCHVTYEVQG
jgi:hypothetical protein